MNNSIDLNTSELIHEILYYVKNKEDYNSAARIMLDNYLSIEIVSQNTLKLSQKEIAKLADKIIESRR